MDKLEIQFKPENFDFDKTKFDKKEYSYTEIHENGTITEKTTQKYIRNRYAAQIEINGTGAIFKLNPNKLYGYIPLKTSKPNYAAVMSIAEKTIKTMPDILVNWETAKIHRMDYNFDLPIQLPYKNYVPVLKLLYPYKRIYNRKKIEFEGTQYFGNKSIMFLFYNKAELDRLQKAEEQIKYECMRFEVRYLKKRLPISEFTEQKFNQYWQKSRNIGLDLFQRNTKILTKRKVINQIMMLSNGIMRLSEAIKNYGIDSMKEDLNEIGISSVMDYIGVTRKDQRQYQKLYRLEGLLNQSIVIESNMIDMYKELKELMLNAS